MIAVNNDAGSRLIGWERVYSDGRIDFPVDPLETHSWSEGAVIRGRYKRGPKWRQFIWHFITKPAQRFFAKIKGMA